MSKPYSESCDQNRDPILSVIKPLLPECKNVLEIGSGTGRLFSFLQEKVAGSIQGVEPSEKNSAASRQVHPEVDVYTGTFADFQSESHFDIVLAIMVFEHLPDLPVTFSKIQGLLKSGGKFYLVVGDYECQTRQETYAKFEKVDLGDGGDDEKQ